MSIFIPHAEPQMNKYSKEPRQRKRQKQTTSLKKRGEDEEKERKRERGLITLAVKIYLCLQSLILDANPLVQFPIP